MRVLNLISSSINFNLITFIKVIFYFGELIQQVMIMESWNGFGLSYKYYNHKWQSNATSSFMSYFIVKRKYYNTNTINKSQNQTIGVVWFKLLINNPLMTQYKSKVMLMLHKLSIIEKKKHLHPSMFSVKNHGTTLNCLSPKFLQYNI